MSARRIMADVARETNISLRDICGPWRFRHIVEARHEAILRVHEQTRLSSSQIGRLFNRDQQHGASRHRPPEATARGGTMSDTFWTPRRDAELRSLWGLTMTEIGKTLGISREQVRRRARSLGLPWDHVKSGGTNYPVWTGEMTDTAETMIGQGRSIDEIAERIGVSKNAVIVNLKKRGLLCHRGDKIAMPISDKARDRRCMTCSKWFLSTGPDNRMCNRCRLNADANPMAPW